MDSAISEAFLNVSLTPVEIFYLPVFNDVFSSLKGSEDSYAQILHLIMNEGINGMFMTIRLCTLVGSNKEQDVQNTVLLLFS